MMLSSWLMKPTWYQRRTCPTKNRTIARPIAIRARCCFRPASGLEEEFHLHARELDDVVVLKRVRRGADRLAIDGRAVGAFDVGDEIALRPAREDGDLHPGLAQGGERLVQL